MIDQNRPMPPTSRSRAYLVTWVFTTVGALNCVLAVSFLVYPLVFHQDGGLLIIWPFPAIYYVEILCTGIVCTIAMARNQETPISFWLGIPWICSGILFAYVIIGAWTFGFFLIPAMIFFLLAGVLTDKRWGVDLALHLIYFVTAGIAQSFLVLLSFYIG